MFLLNRREALLGALGFLLSSFTSAALSSSPLKLVLVHGRSQQGKDPVKLKATWLEALELGADKQGVSLPPDLDVAFPYYGDALDEVTRQYNLPLTSDIQTRGASVDTEFLEFQAEIAEALRQQSGITDEQVNLEYGDNPKERGPQNWEWVQAILRALDKHAEGVGQLALENFTRDVFLYTRKQPVREQIDSIVSAEISEEPTVVVAHSLGSVVAYNILKSDTRTLNVPLFATVGCPLGVRAIRNYLKPLRYPKVGAWYNAFDDRDVVSLYPLDDRNFPITPAVENFDGVNNHTDNRHGIVGYLDDTSVAGKILGYLTI